MANITDDETYSLNKNLINCLEKENAELKKLVELQKNEIERIIEERTKELLDLIETKDKFYRIIAHELRNPFHSILGFLKLLLDNIKNYDLKKIEQYLTIIYRSTNISFELLIQLSDWFNSQKKGFQFSPELTNINQLLSDAIFSAQLSAENKQIEIQNNFTPNIIAFVDKNMISTIFRNLINNAIKFTDSNGTIEISSIETNKFIEISVKDTGVGLDIEYIDKIFELEGIVSSSGTAQETGTGLGLILCKEFVEIEGGKIWVESIIGHGSVFKFTVPKYKQ